MPGDFCLFVCLLTVMMMELGGYTPPPHALASHVTSWKHMQDVNLC